MYIEFLYFQKCSGEESVYIYLHEIPRNKYWLDQIASLTTLLGWQSSVSQEASSTALSFEIKQKMVGR